MEHRRYPQGYFMGLGIGIGISLGIVIGIIIGNVGIGPAIGSALGIPIGIILEKTLNPNPKILSPEEKKRWQKYLLVMLSLGLLAFILVIFSVN